MREQFMKYLGNNLADTTFDGLETFDAPRGVEHVGYTSDEVSALCPVTSQPDWYTVAIQIHGAPSLPESKSLKLYLQSFRNEGLFCEAFAAQISRDVGKATQARICTVVVRQKPRGGIAIEAEATYEA